jgi:cbb3-type cytochrome oxidase subunit 3
MNDTLRQLRDLHLPEAPSWWPPAPGWWLLAVIVIVLLALSVWSFRRRRQRRRPFRQARAELIALRDHLNGPLPDGTFADAANAILRRAMLYGLGRRDAATLTGTEWLEYLDQCRGGNAFTQGAGVVLGNARFAPATTVDRAALCSELLELLRLLERRT